MRATVVVASLLVVFGMLLAFVPQLAFSGIPSLVALTLGAAVVAYAVCCRRARPGLPWVALAAAFAAQGALAVVESSDLAVFSLPWSLPYFVSLGLLALATWAFVAPATLRDTTSLIDTGIVALATALVLYEFLLRPVAAAAADSVFLWSYGATAFGAVVLDVFFAAALVWLWVSLSPADRTGRVLYVALVTMFASNLAWQLSSIGELPWVNVAAAALALHPVLALVAAGLLATAALDRSSQSTVSGFSPDAELSTWRLLVVAVLAAVVPVLALIPYALRDESLAAPALPVLFTVLLWLLLASRVVRLLRAFRLALAVNAAVQDTTVQLLTAADPSRIDPLGQLPAAGTSPRQLPGAVAETLHHPASTAAMTLQSVARLAADRVELQQRLVDVEAQARSRALLEHTADAIVVVDSEDKVVFATPSAAPLFASAARSADVSGLFGTDVWDEVCAAAQSGSPQRFEATLAGAPSRAVQVSVSWVPDEEVFVVTVHDVSELRALASRLQVQAVTDPLTGLLNRAGLRDAVTSLAPDRFTLVLFDLDDFKQVNDLFGHQAGDDLLVDLAGRLLRALPPQTPVARLGGDEFAAVLTVDAGEALQVADATLVSFAAPYRLPQGTLHPGASAGVAADAGDLDETLRRADVALYAAKAGKKGSAVLFDDEQAEQFTSVLETALLLRHDEVAEQLQVAYQPIVAAGADGAATVVGFEALARWQHPTLGPVAPEVFLPLALRANALQLVSQSVLVAALRQWVRWERAGRGDVFVTVNVPPDQVADEAYVSWVLQQLALEGVPASALVVEVLESQLAPSLERLRSGAARLRDAGVRLFLDDFGTGFSSLARLSELEVDGVKTAREFLQSPSGRDLLAPVAALVTAAGVSQLVVEGVESARDVAAVAALAGAFQQGFAFDAPLTPDETMKRLVAPLLPATL